MTEKRDIKSFSLEEMKSALLEIGEKAFRSKQIYEWIHKKGVDSFEDMSNLSKDLREKLGNHFIIDKIEVLERQISKVDNTNKFLFRLKDDYVIESVYMPYHHGNSVCISTQVGCAMGCKFCASTIGGLERNLTTGEMLSQIYEIQKITESRVSNIVVMGTGEPLDNYENLVKFITMISDENGLNISQRNITLSTCGLVPQIYRLGEENLSITLALSLHGSTQEKRLNLMPVARKYDLVEVLKACDDYYKKTGRRLSYEYSLVQEVNDTIEDAEELTKLLKGKNCHLNLIPVNPIKERKYEQSSKKRVFAFKNRLEKNGINVTIRREMGADIDGACGQLRRKHVLEQSREVEA